MGDLRHRACGVRGPCGPAVESGSGRTGRPPRRALGDIRRDAQGLSGPGASRELGRHSVGTSPRPPGHRPGRPTNPENARDSRRRARLSDPAGSLGKHDGGPQGHRQCPDVRDDCLQRSADGATRCRRRARRPPRNAGSCRGDRAVIAATPTRSQIAVFTKKVADFMRQRYHAARPSTPIGDVLAGLAAERVSSALVVDDSGRLVGILTERDVAQRVALRVGADMAVERVMTAPVKTIAGDDLLFRAIGRMRRERLRHMPVVDDDGRPIGVLDLNEALAAAAARMVDQ
ncbi:MAG: CBS domain-containing protein, partial [Alphaproteobacteria bacterium]|nr:CBS domain-containing protein [Alphaproteobacteria bacterium]